MTMASLLNSTTDVESLDRQSALASHPQVEEWIAQATTAELLDHWPRFRRLTGAFAQKKWGKRIARRSLRLFLESLFSRAIDTDHPNFGPLLRESHEFALLSDSFLKRQYNPWFRRQLASLADEQQVEFVRGLPIRLDFFPTWPLIRIKLLRNLAQPVDEDLIPTLDALDRHAMDSNDVITVGRMLIGLKQFTHLRDWSERQLRSHSDPHLFGFLARSHDKCGDLEEALRIAEQWFIASRSWGDSDSATRFTDQLLGRTDGTTRAERSEAMISRLRSRDPRRGPEWWLHEAILRLHAEHTVPLVTHWQLGWTQGDLQLSNSQTGLFLQRLKHWYAAHGTQLPADSRGLLLELISQLPVAPTELRLRNPLIKTIMLDGFRDAQLTTSQAVSLVAAIQHVESFGDVWLCERLSKWTTEKIRALPNDQAAAVVSALPDRMEGLPSWPFAKLQLLQKARVDLAPHLPSLLPELRGVNPSLPFFHTICSVLYQARDWEQAEWWADQATGFISDLKLAAIASRIYREQGRVPEAIGAAEIHVRFARHDGDPVAAMEILFASLLELPEDQIRQATADVVTRLTCDGDADASEIILLQARSALRCRDYADAREHLQRLFRMPLSAGCWTAALKVIHRECSADLQSELLQQLPPHERPFQASLHLLRLHVRARRFDDAAELANSLATSHSDHAEVMLTKVRLHRSKLEAGKALQCCEQLLTSHPNSLPGVQELLRIHWQLLRTSQAEVIALLDRITAPIESGFQRATFRIQCLRAAPLRQAALQEAWTYYTTQSDCREAAQLLSECLQDLGEFGVSEPFLQQASKCPSPTSAQIRELGRIRALRRLLQVSSWTLTEAQAQCEAFVHSRTNGECQRDSLDSETIRRRVLLPECLIDYALTLPTPPQVRRQTICLVTSSLGPGGAERQVVNTARGLAERFDSPQRIKVVATSLEGAQSTGFYRPELQKAGIEAVATNPNEDEAWLRSEVDHPSIERREIANLLRLWPPAMWRRQLLGYYRQLSDCQPRVVHTFQDETNIFGGLAALLTGAPRVLMSGRRLSPLEMHDPAPFLRTAYQRLLQCPQVTLNNNSSAGAKRYANWLEVPTERVPVVHNGMRFPDVNADARSLVVRALRDAADVPEHALVIGGVMRMTEEKRPELWVQVTLGLLEQLPNAYGMLVGAGPLLQQLEQTASQFPAGERLRFLGLRRPVEPWMMAMDLLLLTSRTEGLPNVLIEAQAMGTPVASTDVGGAGETFREHETGLLLRDDSASGITGPLVELFQQPDRLRAMGVAAARHARTDFSISTMVRRTLELYELNQSEFLQPAAED